MKIRHIRQILYICQIRTKCALGVILMSEESEEEYEEEYEEDFEEEYEEDFEEEYEEA